MRQYCLHHATWIIALLALMPLSGYRSAAQDTPPEIPDQEQPEVLSRGPVHEAFAEPVNLQSEEGLVAPNEPPPNIEEVPPAQRPQGDQFAWIPGYWSWDADRSGYIWVSACWRVAPPRMSWVPGYWSRVSHGWEWVAGFWTPAGVRELEYLPVPPMLADVEAPSLPPSADMIWVPPCMYWTQGQYIRRAGYWLAAQPDWVWVPSHYVVTPRGYVFASGHWDYAIERRGVLFAPVYFTAAAYGRVGFSYSPSVVIDVGLLRVNLFAYPRYSHYYFGDYYDDAYVRIGIYPRFDSRRLHTWYDPVYEHDRWQHQRSEPRWEERQRADYSRLRADRNLRPARTFREQESRLAKLPEPQRRALQVAQPIAVAVTNHATPLKFERIDTGARQKISKQATAVRTFRDERTRWESTPASADAGKPPKERGGTVTAPDQRPDTGKPPKERGGTVTAPDERPDTGKPPKERGGTVTAPAPGQEPAPVQPREGRVRQPERVQIPPPPIAGSADVPGVSQKGPPAPPDSEDRDTGGKDTRKDKGDKDTRKDKNERRGD